MNEKAPAVLIVKRGDVHPATRDALRRIGVYVVETNDPASVRFLAPNETSTKGDVCYAALKAFDAAGGYTDAVKTAFTDVLRRILFDAYERTTDGPYKRVEPPLSRPAPDEEERKP